MNNILKFVILGRILIPLDDFSCEENTMHEAQIRDYYLDS